MDSTPYNYFLGGDGRKISHGLRQAIAKELASKVFPTIPNVADLPLGVSFPAQIGFARYDIESVQDRLLVGHAVAVDEVRNSKRRGLGAILLLHSPIFAVSEGRFAPENLEVWHQEILIGKVHQVSKERFALSSTLGDANLILSDEIVLIENGDPQHGFPLQLDLDYIPLFNARSPADGRGGLVYLPNLSACDPFVVMAFVLTLRMIYRRSDF